MRPVAIVTRGEHSTIPFPIAILTGVKHSGSPFPIAIACLLIAALNCQPLRAQIVAGGAARTVTATTGGFSSNSSGNRSAGGARFGRSSTSRNWASSKFQAGFYGVVVAWPPQFVVGPAPIIWAPPIVARPPTVVSAAVGITAVGGDLAPDPGRFIVVRPDKPAAPPVAPPPRADKKPADKKAPDVDLGVAPGNFPLAPGAAGNPRVEADRQVEAGRDAFAKGEYGVALDHFRHATARQPDEAANWFLLAQVQFAIGKYDEAVASIDAGMMRNPEWPKSRFQSREIYGNNRAVFDVHLQNLRDSLAADPEDPRLLFLLGVELWFDGKQDEARTFFEKAARSAKDSALAQAFLKR